MWTTIPICQSLPIGHPDRNKISNNSQNKGLNIACTFCSKRFANGHDIDSHMKEHTEKSSDNGFSDFRRNKACRYFRMGVCVKGNDCKFMHVDKVQRKHPKTSV